MLGQVLVDTQPESYSHQLRANKSKTGEGVVRKKKNKMVEPKGEGSATVIPFEGKMFTDSPV